MSSSIFKKISFRRQSGFTMLEVLIAMSISVIIYMGSYTLLDSVITTDERIQNKRLQLQKLQKAHYLMQQDIEQIVNRSVRSQTGEILNPVKYDGINQSLEFTHTGWLNPIKRPRSEQQRVRYFIEDKKLYREYWNVLDRAGDSEAKKNILLENIEKITFRFYDMKEKQWLSEWRKNPTDKDLLPVGVEINLETNNYGDLQWVFALVNNKDVEDKNAGAPF